MRYYLLKFLPNFEVILMKKSVTRNMTEGAPMKLILGFTLPLMLGLLFQQFYNMVDTIIVGKFLGVTALAGVGSTGAINFLVLGFCSGICAGFAIPVAQKFGQKDYSGLRKYVANAGYLSVFFCLIITLPICIFCEDVLWAMNTDPAFFQEAYDYIFVIFLGIPATVMYNVLSGIIRSLGDSKSPLFFLLLSSVLNIGLDLAFVCWLDMGVAGPARATVISQAISGICCLVYMVKRFDILKMTKEERRPSFFHMGKLCAMGIPMGLQYSVTAIGSIVLQSAINSFGTIHVAAIAAGDKVNNLIVTPLNALGTASATYAGQNMGALRLDRVKTGLKDFLILGISYALLAFVMVLFWGDNIALLFMDSEDPASVGQVLSLTQQFLNVSGSFYTALFLVYVFRFTIQGLGYSNVVVLAGVFELAARCIVTWGFAPRLGFDALCWASPTAWIAADIFLIPCFCICMKKLKKRYPNAVTSG